jgi:ubiquinone/menaquinone biosynthesis C-methylase UbiE
MTGSPSYVTRVPVVLLPIFLSTSLVCLQEWTVYTESRKMSKPYDRIKAETYWSTRLHQTSELAAVLSFNLPEYLNRTYSEWEIHTVIKSLPNLRGLTVLDLGCGVGRVTVPLAQQGAWVTAFDISAEMLAACRRNAATLGVADQITYGKGSTDVLPFPDQTFDVVACLGVLEHLPPPVRQTTLENIIRVVRRPGWVAIVVNNAESRFLTKVARYEMQKQQENGYFVGLIGQASIESFFTQAGFAVRNRGSNLFQSLVKHISQRLGLFDDSLEIMPELARLSMRLDIAYPNKGDLDTAFADQWIIVANSLLAD